MKYSGSLNKFSPRQDSKFINNPLTNSLYFLCFIRLILNAVILLVFLMVYHIEWNNSAFSSQTKILLTISTTS
jgi:hypothetical protein